MKKVRTQKELGHHQFICPGCQCEHNIDSRWSYNDNPEKPTFQPSYLLKGSYNNKHNQVCHSFITDGQIKFLNDCTHELKGQTVELPEID